MTRSLRPSCLRVRARAAKRRSLATRRETQEERRVREARKEAVEPRTVAVATMSQLEVVLVVSETTSLQRGSSGGGWGLDIPNAHAVDEAGNGYAARVSYQWRE